MKTNHRTHRSLVQPAPRPTFRPIRGAAVASALLAVSACSTDPGNTHRDPDYTGPEVVRSASASIAERDITASFVGDDIEVRFPITRGAVARIDGTLRVTLVDISGEEEDVDLGSSAAPIAQTERTQTHRAGFAGLAAGLERADAAGIVIAWEVQIGNNSLHGKRSLYAALGKLEVQLRGPTEVVEGRSSPFTVVVRDADQGTPVEGAAIEASLERAAEGETQPEPVALFSGTSDARGELFASLALPAGIESGSLVVSVRHGDAHVWATTNVRSIVDRKVYLSADKTIYKPGQTVELRLLALDGTTRQARAGETVVFEALDGKGNKVFKRTGATDSFGVAAVSVPTDTRINEGDWKFRADVAGARQELTIPVVRYNLPKMRVDVAPSAAYVIPGEMVSGAVTAMYLFGEPVAGAQVYGEVSTKSGSFYTSFNGTTDPTGHYALSFQLPTWLDAPSLEDGSERLLFDVRIVDTADQEEHGAAGMVVARAPIVIDAITELGALVPGVDNRVFFLVSDPLGRPLVANVNVGGVSGIDGLVTDDTGVATLRFVPPAGDGALSLSITATDGAARSHTRTFDLARAGAGSIELASDAAVYLAGETAMVSVIAPPAVTRVYLDIYRGAEGIETRAVDLQSGTSTVAIAVTEGMRGLVVLQAFALGASGEVLEGELQVMVDPEDRLAVSLSADAESYLPGAPAEVSVSVTGADGSPKVASVGLNVVNEASFALGGEPATDLRTALSADPRLLPANVSVLGRNATDLFALPDSPERDRLAQILFARARGVTKPGFSYNSVREELPAVRSAIEDKITRDVETYLQAFTVLVQAGHMTWDNMEEVLEPRIQGITDPFGRYYSTDVRYEGWTYTLDVDCNGPDEIAGTPDDIEMSLWIDWLLYGWDENYYRGGEGGMWGGEADMDGGGPMAGGVDDAAAPPADPSAETNGAGASPSRRVRADFRETVLSNPTLITDAGGTARVSFPLADSITTWRVSADASTTIGELGSGRASFRTFQSFFVDFDVPTSLTVGDVLTLPAVIYNYLPEPTDVTVTLESDGWLQLLGSATETLSLGPSEVRSVKFDVLVLEAGEHDVTLYGNAGATDDALVRVASVDPDGFVEDATDSDRLNGLVDHDVNVPADALEGGTTVTLSLTPGFAAEAVQGVEGLMQEPSGCFEQTTSSAWPNTLVTSYLEQTGQLTDELREQAFGMVTRGYQRLLTFESPTGGFNWWGDSEPGNRILSAIFLWHSKDLELLIETDEAVRDRTLAWLLEQQNGDGSFDAGDALHAGNEVLGTSKVRTTAFIGWALAHTGWAPSAVSSAMSYLQSNAPDGTDLYATALAANALAKGAPSSPVTTQLFARLDELKETRAGGSILWPTEAPSWTGAGGDTAAIETTGLVAYGLLESRLFPENAANAVRFIISNKDAVGSWYNTQATMNALRALSAAASPQGSDADGTLVVRVNGLEVYSIPVTPETGDVYQTFDLTDFVAGGDNVVTLDFAGTGEVSYKLNRRVFRPTAPASAGPLGLNVTYDTTTPTVGSPVTATVVATNYDVGTRDQVIVRLGRAPGFVPRAEDLDEVVAQGLASRAEVREDDITFYLMGVHAGESRQLVVRMTPTLAIDGSAPPSRIYPYYEPQLVEVLDPQRFVVSE